MGRRTRRTEAKDKKIPFESLCRQQKGADTFVRENHILWRPVICSKARGQTVTAPVQRYPQAPRVPRGISRCFLLNWIARDLPRRFWRPRTPSFKTGLLNAALCFLQPGDLNRHRSNISSNKMQM